MLQAPIVERQREHISPIELQTNLHKSATKSGVVGMSYKSECWVERVLVSV